MLLLQTRLGLIRSIFFLFFYKKTNQPSNRICYSPPVVSCAVSLSHCTDAWRVMRWLCFSHLIWQCLGCTALYIVQPSFFERSCFYAAMAKREPESPCKGSLSIPARASPNIFCIRATSASMATFSRTASASCFCKAISWC